MKRTNRPTGIIRTLPSLYGKDEATEAAKKFNQCLENVEKGSEECLYIALSAMPKIVVLHMYLLIDGEITVRLNIVGFEDGSAAECFDKTIRSPKYWALCTAPVSRPNEPIKRRGFQGFRYTEDLW